MALTILTGTVKHTYIVYRYPLRHQKDDHEVISVLRSLLTDNPPIHPPLSLSRSVGTGRREPWERSWLIQKLILKLITRRSPSLDQN